MKTYKIANAGDRKGILYLSTIHTPESKSLLESSVDLLLAALCSEVSSKAQVLYQLYYEQQSASANSLAGEQRIFEFPPSPVSLALEDSMLDPVHQAWVKAMGREVSEETLAEYMIFTDREGADDDDCE